MKNIEINSLKELLDTVRALNSENRYWFRGHANISYILNPSSYRELYIFEDQFYRPVEPRLVTNYNNRGDHVLLLDQLYLKAFFDKLDEKKITYDKTMNIVEKYCFAQHYGVWTPMLDWTTDLSVALFFADDGRQSGEACAIFLLDPKKWNKESTGKEEIFLADDVVGQSFVFPIALVGMKTDKRMCRQSGNFTAHGEMIWPLEYYSVKDDILIKISIPGKVADDLRGYLKAFGITRASIYVEDDEKDEISKQLKEINEKTLEDALIEKRNVWMKTPISDRGNSTHFIYERFEEIH